MVLFLELFMLTKIKREKGVMVECNNLTLLNLILVYGGPMPESRLALWVMAVQTLGSVFAFVVRYGLGHYLF